ncbi:MAG TPA: hypothetical protein VGH27_04320 [Streptosporangiaceae bacterium]
MQNLFGRIGELSQDIQRISYFADWLDLEDKRGVYLRQARDLLRRTPRRRRRIPCFSNFIDWLDPENWDQFLDGIDGKILYAHRSVLSGT